MKAFSKKNLGLITAVELKSKKVKALYWANFAIIAVISFICLFPPVWIFMSSFKDIKEFLSVPPTIIPRSFHPEKLPEVWNMLHFGKYYINTFVMAIGELAFSVIVNGLAGYVISRLKPKGSTTYFMVILWTMMMPGSIRMVPLFMTFLDFPIIHTNFMDTYIPMWMMAGANAFNVLLFKNFFDSIPMSFLEAARIDGCSELGIFGRIILPLSKPIMMVVTIFSINASWESFLWPYLIVKDRNMDVISVAIYNLKLSGLSMDKYMIVLLFSIIPPAIIFLLFQRYIINGVQLGGIKE